MSKHEAEPNAAAPTAQAVDIAIIGGGASGLAAAITAARAGASVCVIERDVEAGLPLLATGNGRCNLSNALLDPGRYRHPEQFLAVAGAKPEARIRDFFESLGLLLAEEDEGRLYPRTRRAESVRDVLLDACEREVVRIRACCTPVSARFDAGAGAWALAVREPASPLRPKRGKDAHAALRNKRKALEGAPLVERGLTARRVIIACGGASEAAAMLFNLPHLPEAPALCPIACRLAAGSMGVEAQQRLDGLRVEGVLTLTSAGEPIWQEPGEVLLRSWGLSGIAAFNLSRRLEPGCDIVELDLFPECSGAELSHALHRREELLGPLAAAGPEWFDGLLAPQLGAVAHGALRGSAEPLPAAAALLKHLPFEVEGLARPEQAQVRRGGIPLDALDPATLAVRPAPAGSLFACGEALDMDADCGGYNLAWAWLSGLCAGEAAARVAR